MAMQPYGSGMNRKGFSAQGMAGSVAGGGMRSNGNAPALATPGFNPQASMPVPVVGKWRGYGQMLASSGPSDAWSMAQGRSPRPQAADNSLGATVGQFQDFAREGVQGYAAMAGDDLQRKYGQMLGDLNGIGALRSGGVQQGLMDLNRGYAREIGNVASQATLGAIGFGQEEQDREIERRFRERAYKDNKKASRRRMFGQLLGGAASFIPGIGPIAGPMIGKAAGG